VSEIVYLDVCCLKRPFDDTRAERVRREAEAVASILEGVGQGRFRLVHSPAHDFENERNPREDRRMATRLWLRAAEVVVGASEQTAARSREILALGFGPLDALHLAFAEASAARWFVTTDDRLLKVASRNRERLHVKTVGPDQVTVEGGRE
jgi:predicted nucleic acid-binding protein